MRLDAVGLADGPTRRRRRGAWRRAQVRRYSVVVVAIRRRRRSGGLPGGAAIETATTAGRAESRLCRIDSRVRMADARYDPRRRRDRAGFGAGRSGPIGANRPVITARGRRLKIDALGVVFGDIVTRPCMRADASCRPRNEPTSQSAVMECCRGLLGGHIIVSIKYVSFISARQRREGGSMALIALIKRAAPSARRGRATRWHLARALYGDA